MLNECIAAFGNHGGQRLLVKNRDKSYKPKLDFYHEIRNDTEMLYYIDELVNHLEGMNEHGVGIIYTTSIFQDDTVDRLTDNVYMVLKALESKTAKGAIDPLVNLRGGVHGLIFVSGEDGTYLVEHDSNLDTAKARKIEVPNSWEVITNSPTMLESGIDPAAGETYVSCQIRKALAEAALYGITDIEEALSALAYKYFDEDSHHNMLRTSDFETTCAQLGMDLNNKKCYVTPVPGAVDSYKLVNKLPSGYDSKIDLVERSFTEPTVAPFKIFTRKIDEGVQKFNLVNYLIDDGPESDNTKLDDKYSKHFKDNTDLELAQKAAEAMWEKEKILLSLRRKLESDPIFFTAGQTSNQVQKEIGMLDSMIDRCTADWEKLVDYIYYERFGEPRPQLEEAKKRRPRKKGQRKNSSKHDDLYTNENPKGDIKGLGFKDPATARKGIAIVNKAKRTHAHKVQATLVMVQRGKVAIKRTKDPEKKKNLKAANKLWSAHLEKLKKKTKKMNESNSGVPLTGRTVLISKQDFQSLVREAVILEKKLASVSDVVRYNPKFQEWAEVLIDDFAAVVGDMKDISPKTKSRLVSTVVDAVQSALVSATSSMSYASHKKYEKEKAEKAYNKERLRRTAPIGPERPYR